MANKTQKKLFKGIMYEQPDEADEDEDEEDDTNTDDCLSDDDIEL